MNNSSKVGDVVTLPDPQIEGFILAGGSSSRMGRDKSALMIGGLTLIERAAEALTSVADPVYIVGNIGPTTSPLSILPDVEMVGEIRGSIVGLYTAALCARTKWMAILACDMPFVDSSLLQTLSKMLPFRIGGACRAVLAEQPDGGPQPLCGFYSVEETRRTIESMLAIKDRRLREVARKLDACVLDFAELAHLPNARNLFLNINTPGDYEAALAIQRRQDELSQ